MNNFINNTQKNFTIIQNELLNNVNINFEVKGLYCFLISKPSGWNFSAERIALQSKESESKIKRLLRELENLNLLKRTKIKNENGQFVGIIYEILYTIGSNTDGGKTIGGKTIGGNCTNISNTELSNTNNSNTNKDILSEQSSDDRKLLNLDVKNESYEVKLTKSFFDLFKNNLISCGRKSFTTYDNTKLSSWLVHIKRMIEVDGVTRNEFLEIYNWLKSDYKESNFWKSNIVSTQKLREKFGQLQVAMNKDLQTIKKDDKKKVDKTKNTTMGL